MVNLFLQLIVAFGLAWDTQKNRMFEVGRDLKDNLIPRLLPKAGHLTLSQNQRITEPKITEPFFTHLLDQLSQGPIPGLWASFYSLSLSISYLFIHTSLLVSLSSFFLLGSVAPGVYPMTLYQADPWRKRPKSLIPESKTSCVSSLCWHLLDCLQPAYLSCIRGKLSYPSDRHQHAWSPLWRSCGCGGAALCLERLPAIQPSWLGSLEQIPF